MCVTYARPCDPGTPGDVERVARDPPLSCPQEPLPIIWTSAPSRLTSLCWCSFLITEVPGIFTLSLATFAVCGGVRILSVLNQSEHTCFSGVLSIRQLPLDALFTGQEGFVCFLGSGFFLDCAVVPAKLESAYLKTPHNSNIAPKHIFCLQNTKTCTIHVTASKESAGMKNRLEQSEDSGWICSLYVDTKYFSMQNLPLYLLYEST